MCPQADEPRPEVRAQGSGAIAIGINQGLVTNRVFVGAYSRLGDVTIDAAREFSALNLEYYVDRDWLTQDIDRWIAAERSGYIVIQADAGMGKSAYALNLALTRGYTAHLTRQPGGEFPEAARRNIAAQLIARYELSDLLVDGQMPPESAHLDWFDRVLARASEKNRDVVEPLVVVVDGLDEAVSPVGATRSLPLGLPSHLPDGVFVVVTSRFGPSLSAITGRALWREISLESPENQADLDRYIRKVTVEDKEVAARLRAARVDEEHFCRQISARCQGLWIYAAYILGAIRDGEFSPDNLASLPGNLTGYYASEIERWKADQDLWSPVRLPLLGVLAAVKVPLDIATICDYAGVPEDDRAHTFLRQTAAAFLAIESREGRSTFALKHQSFREFLSGSRAMTRNPDERRLVDRMRELVLATHARLTRHLTPAPGPDGRPRWDQLGPYSRQYLPDHAAASGNLDALVQDPGFLLTVDRMALLRCRHILRLGVSQACIGAYELGLRHWVGKADQEKAWWLHVTARKLQVEQLADASRMAAGGEWEVSRAWWLGSLRHVEAGQVAGIQAVAIGEDESGWLVCAGAGTRDGAIRLWRQGEPRPRLLRGHDVTVQALALGAVDGRPVLVSGGSDGSVRVWSLGDMRSTQLVAPDGGWVQSVAVGRFAGRDVVVTGHRDGSVKVWDAGGAAAPVHVLGGRTGAVSAVAVGALRGSNVVVSGGHDGVVRIQKSGAEPSIHLEGNEGPIRAVAIGRVLNRDTVVSGAAVGTVRLWDVDGHADPIVLPGQVGGVQAVALGKLSGRDVVVAGAGAATGEADGTVRVWFLDTLADPVVLQDCDGWVNSVGVRRVGASDLVISGSRSVRIWDLAAGPTPAVLRGFDGWIRCLGFGPTDMPPVVIAGLDDATARILDAARDTSPRTVFAGDEPVECAALCARGRDLSAVVIDAAGVVHVHDAATGAEEYRSEPHGALTTASVRSVRGDVYLASVRSGTPSMIDLLTLSKVGGPITGSVVVPSDVAWVRWCVMGAVPVLIAARTDGIVDVYGTRSLLTPVARLTCPGPVTQGRIYLTENGEGHLLTLSEGPDPDLRVFDMAQGNLITQRRLRLLVAPTAVDLGLWGEEVVVAAGSAKGRVEVTTVPFQDLVSPSAAQQAPAPITLLGHDGPVRALRIGYFGDRRVLLSGAEDRTIMAWARIGGA